MIQDSSWREKNRAMWHAKTPLHLNSPLYDVAGFKAGGLSLKARKVLA